MVRVGVCKHYCVELRQGIERNSWCTYTWQEFTKGRIKIRIGEKSFPSDLN